MVLIDIIWLRIFQKLLKEKPIDWDKVVKFQWAVDRMQNDPHKGWANLDEDTKLWLHNEASQIREQLGG